MNAFRQQKRERKLKRIDKKRQEPIQQLEPRRLLSMTPALDLIPDASTSALSGFSPSQIATAYGVTGLTFSNGKIAANGAGQTVAIVDAYNDPTIASDLESFDSHFGLPAANLKVVNQTGGSSLPASDGGWAQGKPLDVEWIHFISPGANILPVEALGFSTSALVDRINEARGASGISVVSESSGTATTARPVAVPVPSNPPTSFATTVSNVGALEITQARYDSSATGTSPATLDAGQRTMNGQSLPSASPATGSGSAFKGFAPVPERLPLPIIESGGTAAPSAAQTIAQDLLSVRVFAQETIAQLGRDVAIGVAHDEMATAESMIATFSPERRATAAAIAATVVAIACLESEADRNKKKLPSMFSGRMIALIPER